MMLTKRRLSGLTTGDLLFGAFVMLIAGVVGWKWHHPKYLEMRALSVRLDDQREARRRLDELLVTIDRTTRDTLELEQRLTGFEQRVLGERRTGAYLEQVSNIQDTCGVDVQQIEPGSHEYADRHEIIPIRVIARGSFSDALCFVHELESEMWSAELVGMQLRTELGEADCELSLDVRFYAERGPNDLGEDNTGDTTPGA